MSDRDTELAIVYFECLVMLGDDVQKTRQTKAFEDLQESTVRQYLQVTKQMLMDIKAGGDIPDLRGYTRSGANAIRAAVNTVLHNLYKTEECKEALLLLGAIEAKYPTITETQGIDIWSEARPDNKRKKEYALFEKKNPNWQRDMFYEYKTADQQDVAAVLALCGARPSEIERGVRVSLINIEDEERLLFQIEGTKLTEKSGQPWRNVLVVVNEKPETQCLKDTILECGGNEITIKMKSKTVGDIVSKCGQRLGLNVIAYYYRHGFARYIKNTFKSREKVAMAMGHLTDKTQGYYGSTNSKEKSKIHHNLDVLEVVSAREIKVREMTTFFQEAKEHAQTIEYKGPDLSW